ncbi:hypothetical protein [Bradyrhizobium sp. CB2312]|uniref:hypothetical protein n=1 Tax=Bradyrhizobium sp. CB2312 TaxID=3039155 RepID=UPI0024B12AB2|nr:hypothetical protein [Bradyrhizobium sp. CB2312]WFU69054.1 hypothetical protein QA642_27510 [Bradyrhizobium sp. CB2312]
MGNRTAKFISALIGSIIAGAPIAAVSQNAPAASSPASDAADCLASPKGIAPQGQHWYYRLERSTKRQCWYLRAEGGKDNAKDGAKPVQTAAETPAADSAAPTQHPVQDARAEYLKPRTPAAPAQLAPTAPAPMQQAADPAADSSAQQPAVASPWPDASTATSPAPQPAPAPVATPSTKATKSAAPVALAAADSSTDKPAGSIQMLLLVIGGALALAGVLASIIYRFAGRRARQADRRAHWDDWEPQDENPSRAPWLDDASRVQKAGPVDFDAVRPLVIQPQAVQPKAVQPKAAQPKAAQLAEFSSAIGRIAAHAAPARKVIADLDEADIFNGEFKIEASAPQLAANDASDEAPADREADEDKEDAVDIDVITAMLERLAQEGPRLRQPSLEADLADFAQIPRGQSAARA